MLRYTEGKRDFGERSQEYTMGPYSKEKAVSMVKSLRKMGGHTFKYKIIDSS